MTKPPDDAMDRASKYCKCGHRFDWHQGGMVLAYDPHAFVNEGDTSPGHCYGCKELHYQPPCQSYTEDPDPTRGILGWLIGDNGHGDR